MDSAKVKLAAVGMPFGREARRISRLVVSLVIEEKTCVGELVSGKPRAEASRLTALSDARCLKVRFDFTASII